MGGGLTIVRQYGEYLYEKFNDVKRKPTRKKSVMEEASRILREIKLNIEEERKKYLKENKEEEKKKNRERMWRIESCGGEELVVVLLDHPKGDVRADSMRVVERMGVCVMRGGHIDLAFVNIEKWRRKGDRIIKIENNYTSDTCMVDEKISEV
jgi:hypothetical protein